MAAISIFSRSTPPAANSSSGAPINVFGEEEDIQSGEFVAGKKRGFLFTDRPCIVPARRCI